MAFTEIELARIKKAVGGLCDRRNRPDLKSELSLEYRVKGHDVIVFERRPKWDGSLGHMETDVAKLKFARSSGAWRLLWMRADLKWHAYKPTTPSTNLLALVAEIDADPYGCFFG